MKLMFICDNIQMPPQRGTVRVEIQKANKTLLNEKRNIVMKHTATQI